MIHEDIDEMRILILKFCIQPKTHNEIQDLLKERGYDVFLWQHIGTLVKLKNLGRVKIQRTHRTGCVYAYNTLSMDYVRPIKERPVKQSTGSRVVRIEDMAQKILESDRMRRRERKSARVYVGGDSLSIAV